MKQQTKRNLILLVTVLFIGVNIFLIYSDEDKVDRLSYVNEWTQTEQKDMYEKLRTEGVLDYADTQDVYFDDNAGEFQEFLIEEGAHVEKGDALYTYNVHDYYEAMAEFQSEEERLEGEIDSVEASINKMESYQIPQQIMEYRFDIQIEDGETETNQLETPQDAAEAEYFKEQYITEKESELKQKEAQLDAIQSQLEELSTTGDTVTVESPVAGNITEVSRSLDNPILTIQPPELHVEGDLSEEERKQVTRNMLVDIDVDGMDGELSGVVDNIGDHPHSVSISGKSTYPFSVSIKEEEGTEEDLSGDGEDSSQEDEDQSDGEDFSEEETDPSDRNEGTSEEGEVPSGEDDNPNGEEETDPSRGEDPSGEEADPTDAEDVPEDAEDPPVEGEDPSDEMLAGYHAGLEIILYESPNATVMDVGSMVKGDAWRMDADGKMEKRSVEEGIRTGNEVEVTKSLGPGDWLAEEPTHQFREEATFITPVKLHDVKWDGIFQTSYTWQSFWAGLYAR